jgi:hypothetical protein
MVLYPHNLQKNHPDKKPLDRQGDGYPAGTFEAYNS